MEAKDFLRRTLTVVGKDQAVEDKNVKFLKKYATVVGSAEAIEEVCYETWYLIKDEESWDAAYAIPDGALQRYYAWSDKANAPYKEDLWNTVENRAANINDARKDPETGEYVLDENGNYIYDNCVRCWLGAINATGACYPWAVIEPPIPFTGTVKLVYKDEKTVYPWGEEVRTFGRGFGCASIPTEFNMPELKCNADGEPVDGDPAHVVVREDIAVSMIPA